MSHADGLAILPDGTSYYFEYNGTCDVCCTRLYKEYEDLEKNWRGDNHRDCVCRDKKHKEVMLVTSYGRDHFLFFSTICETCMCITGKTMEDWA